MSFVCAKFHVDSCGRKDVISYLQSALSLILCNGGYRTCYMSDMSYAKYLHMIRLSYIHSVEPPPNRKLASDPVTISQTSTVADPPIITLMLEAEQGVVVPHLLQ